MKQRVSQATLANWKRLGSTDKKLLHRANKTDSLRKIFPDKYIINKTNKARILAITDFIAENELEPVEFICRLAVSAVYQAPTICQKNKERFYRAVAHKTVDLTLLPDNDLFTLDLQEPDFLGALYQTLQAEGARNKNGLYYTPANVADQLLAQLPPSSSQDYLDPAVGTGIFLIELVRRFAIPLAQLHGTDSDPIAVLLATANLLLQAPPEDQTYPDIQVCDFLQTTCQQKCSVIVGNPPWGAKKITAVSTSQLGRADSFAYFIEKSLAVLPPDGNLAFVLPVSLLNIAIHEPVRRLILTTSSVKSVTYLPHLFQGVVSDVVLLVLRKGFSAKQSVTFFKDTRQVQLPQKVLTALPHHNFLPLQVSDRQIIQRIWQGQHFNLSNSDWGLGIVTGNNRQLVLDESAAQTEPIITGKDVQPYKVTPLEHHLKFQPERFQQTASEDLYRTPEKLVYKFINNRLIFAYDDQQHLTLNSANILLPHMPTHSIKTVLAFLNSQLFQYLNKVLFASPKVLRGNLEKLPFTALNAQELTHLEKLVTTQLAGQDVSGAIDQFVFAKYDLIPAEVARIQEVLSVDVFA